MFKSALIETLKTFSREDIKDFGLFVQSPFYNTNQSVIKLFEQIKKLYPEFEESQTEKKLLFERSFGNIRYNDSFLRMTVFRLMELAKEFLIQRNLQRNNLMKEILLLDELSFRELKNLMMKSVKGLDKKIAKQKLKEAETYFAKFKLEYYKNEDKARDTKMITYKDVLVKDLMLEQESLNIFFFISSLKFFQYYLNQKNYVVNTGGYPDFMKDIMDFLKQNIDYLNVPVLKVYYFIVLMFTTKDDKYFFELKKILFENKDDISYSEKFNLITTLRNYAQFKYNNGNEDFKTDMIELLKFSIGMNILTPAQNGKYISEMRFMNIVWTGIRSNELDWLEKFIKKFIDRIEPDKKIYVLAYGTACIEFERGNFNKALEILGKSGPVKNVYYKAAIKQLTLMIYYELQWFVPAADLLDAYRHFIRKDKLLPEIHSTYINSFIDYFNRLIKLNDKPDDNAFEISELLSELKSTSLTWLMKKAQELKLISYKLNSTQTGKKI